MVSLASWEFIMSAPNLNTSISVAMILQPESKLTVVLQQGYSSEQNESRRKRVTKRQHSYFSSDRGR